MSDIIQLLPDSVANQIAAGEVIQRPASVIKELVENAIDAGATNIKVIAKDAGRTLIQVIDNGCGMSESDARLCFDRHATSKIRNANDLFAIRTMGFRGEALASIAAVAHVELKTRQHNNELGTFISVEGSQVKAQEQVSCPVGTNFCVKNLFYNVPARRKFLKKDSTEFRHIVNEFQRIALANNDIEFTLIHNDITSFSLAPASIKQRIVKLVGKNMNQNLVSVEIEASLVKLKGFVGKPESARKSGGEQFFFVNGRFMKHPYLNKAVVQAYDNLIHHGSFPSYFLFLEVDPNSIDINIHPTKTEIKFEEERAVWQIINSAVRESLAKHNLMPTIDFDTEDRPHIPVADSNVEIRIPDIGIDPSYNPFEQGYESPEDITSSSKSSSGGGNFSNSIPHKKNTNNWEQLYTSFESDNLSGGQNNQNNFSTSEIEHDSNSFMQNDSQLEISNSEDTILPNVPLSFTAIQLSKKYILVKGKTGLMIIHQRRAHQRILYEKLLSSVSNGEVASQQTLFPETLEFDANDSLIISELMPQLKKMGFNIDTLSQNKFEIKAIPAAVVGVNTHKFLEELIELSRDGEVEDDKVQQKIALSLAKQSAINNNKTLSVTEMEELVGSLFACKSPNYSPKGKTVIHTLSKEQIDSYFV